MLQTLSANQQFKTLCMSFLFLFFFLVFYGLLYRGLKCIWADNYQYNLDFLFHTLQDRSWFNLSADCLLANWFSGVFAVCDDGRLPLLKTWKLAASREGKTSKTHSSKSIYYPQINNQINNAQLMVLSHQVSWLALV